MSGPILPALEEGLLRYFAASTQRRRERVEAVLAAMTDRERRLVREVAVMANVHGTQRGLAGVRDIPADTAVLHAVIAACLAMPDLYTTIDEVVRPEGGEAR